MDRVEPRDRGHEPGDPLKARGRAKRQRCADGSVLWRLPAEDERSAARLLKLATSGVGGFVDGGVDDEGVWLLRAMPATSLAELRREQPRPWPFERVLSVAQRIARALAACEAASLFPGALTPRTLLVALTDNDDERVHLCLPAENLVSAMVGTTPSDTGHSLAGAGSNADDLLWSPPEHGDDALWDSAANRYALGAISYTLLAGEHPFGGAGLRHALSEARHAEPAPFPRDIARQLPPGMMSLCLRMIDPKRAARPDSAEAIAVALDRLIDRDGGAAVVAVGRSKHEADEDEEVSNASSRQPSRREAPVAVSKPERDGSREPIGFGELASMLSRGRGRWVSPLLGIALCAIALAFAARQKAPPPRRTVTVPPVLAVAANQTRAADCASCHPRHAAEWSQSVMGHSVKSPLFNALESLIEEQVGRDRDCPGGAGILRRAGGSSQVCRDRNTGLSITGAGGEHWCVNCHAPGDNLGSNMPAWEGKPGGDPRSRHPVRDLIAPAALEGISCAFCHQVHAPVGPNGSPGYQGNPSWTSFVSGTTFLSRPEDRRGLHGIANSGYSLDPAELLLSGPTQDEKRLALVGGFPVHARPSEEARRYLASSDFCGSCHDVRLFGTDVVGARSGEHFKRLRNAYSEWSVWADGERRAGRKAASCQDCHMSTYPGICAPGEPTDDELTHEACPSGTHFEAQEPGRRVNGRVATTSTKASAISPHYFSAVDLPMARDIADAALDQDGLDAHGLPLSFKKRRDLLLRRSLKLDLGEVRRAGASLEIPLTIENVGAGHKMPAGFSQEREVWVHLRVEDGRGNVLYEVGRVDRNDEDLHDKEFVRVNTDPDRVDGLGQPLGMFGADVRDGPDVPRWSPLPELGGTEFRGKGLINFQNGFQRCVRCISEVSASGECLPLAFERHRAERYTDGVYDIDTGDCLSNLNGRAALFEVYFPIGALDADRGAVKGPDAIMDTRSLSPGKPVRFTYELRVNRQGPLTVTARLMFRSFPPFLVRAFADYEAKQAQRGRRPSGPLVSFEMLQRLERIELARRTLVVP